MSNDAEEELSRSLALMKLRARMRKRQVCTKTRLEAVRHLENMLEGAIVQAIPGAPGSIKRAHHWGLVEFRHFLDFLYGGPPRTPEEELKR